MIEASTGQQPAPAEGTGPARLAQFLSDPDAGMRLEAARLLGKMGPAAALAVPALIAAVNDRNLKLRLAATTALGCVGAAAEPAIPALVFAMTGAHMILARLAAQALGRIGRPAVAALVELLRSKDSYVRREAAWALGEIGSAVLSATTDALPPTPASLIETVPQRRHAITPIIPLSREEILVGPPAPSSVPGGPTPDPVVALTAALTDSDPRVQSAAGQALKKIRGEK